VKQFATTTRSKVYNVTITNGSPRLVIACYAQGQTQRSLLSVWRTVTVLHHFMMSVVEAVLLFLYISRVCSLLHFKFVDKFVQTIVPTGIFNAG